MENLKQYEDRITIVSNGEEKDCIIKCYKKITVILNDGSKLLLKNSGSNYTVIALENQFLFDYMQSSKINIKQRHNKIRCLIRIFNDALNTMSYRDASDKHFKEGLWYKPHKKFFIRNFKDFQINNFK